MDESITILSARPVRLLRHSNGYASSNGIQQAISGRETEIKGVYEIEMKKDDYRESQLVDILQHYMRQIGKQVSSEQEFKDMLLNDKEFHKWFLNETGDVFAYYPLTEKWLWEASGNEK